MRLIGTSILCLFATLAAAQAAGDSGPTPITIEPTHRLSFPDSPDIGSVAFSPDGKVMYVHLRPQAADVWAMLVYVWPEGLGAVVGIAAVITGLVVWRVRRRPQKKGVKFCRRCNYELSGLRAETSTCPECGADFALRRMRLGRSWWMRVGPVLAVFAVLACVYGWMMLVARLPRQGAANRWVDWSSTSLKRASKEPMLGWLSSFSTPTDRVEAVETETGLTLRTVYSQSASTWFPMTASPDGRHLMLANGQDLLIAVDTATGKVRTKFRAPEQVASRGEEWYEVSGFTRDGSAAYAAFVDNSLGEACLARCDLDSGKTERVASFPAYKFATSGGFRWMGGPMFPLGGQPEQFVAAQHGTEVYLTNTYLLRRYVEGVGPLPPIDAGIDSAFTTPVVTPDGGRLFVAAGVRGVAGFDLNTGESLGMLVLPGARAGLRNLAIAPDGDFLCVSTHPNEILVRRISTREWVASLTYSRELIAPDLRISPDGRWLAAVAFRAASPQGPYPHEVMVFDLRSVVKPPDR
jgi:hypothetical protein